MARRAGFISDYRTRLEGTSPLLLLAGPNEFVDPETRKPRSDNFHGIPNAFKNMNYHAGLLSTADHVFFLENNLQPPPSFFFVEYLTLRHITVKNVRITLLLLPQCEDVKATAQLASEIADMLPVLRRESDLTVAISPLGLELEKEFLGRTEGLDVLLGGGPGYGFSSKIAGTGKTIWTRPFTRGKTLNIITLYVLPSNDSTTWTKGANFQAEAIPLDDSIRQDQTVQQLLEANASASKPAKK